MVAALAKLVGKLEAATYADRECRVEVEEKAVGVVVVEEHEHVGLLLGEPARDRLVALEQGRPSGLVLPTLVVGHADRGYV